MGIVPFPRAPSQVGFERAELTRILDLYGRMVAAGHWRDYAMDLGRDAAIFRPFAVRRSGLNIASKNAPRSAIDRACGR